MEARVIEISGKPYDRGVQYGKQAKDLIDICISNYSRYIAIDSGMDWAMARRVATGYKKRIEAFRPDYIDEMKGIADGAGCEFEDILALNCRSELRAMSGYVPAECTAFGVLPLRSADGHTYTGQNWDNQTLQRKCMVIVKIRRDDGPDVMLFTEAGFIGGKGMNGNGVSLMLNALFVGYEKEALPLHIKMRAAVECGDISSAFSALATGATGVGANLLLGTEGMAVSLELLPHDNDAILPTDGIVVHTNHILSPRFAGVKDNYRNDGSTFLRFARADCLLRSKDKVSKDDIIAMLSDHSGYPFGICTHVVESDPEDMQYSTNYSVIVDNTEKVAYYCCGNPCEGEFKAYRL